MHVQCSGQIIDPRHMQMHRAQRDEHPGRRDAASALGQQPAVHGHRLRAVFAQVHRAQDPVAAQRIFGAAMRRRRELDRIVVPGNHGVEQAHRVAMRDKVLPLHFRQHAGHGRIDP